MRANALGCPNGSPWLNAAQRWGAGWPDLRAATGSNGQPAGNQGAACNALKRRDFWQPGGTGGLILSYEKKEGMGAGEVEKVESGGKSRPCCPCCQKPKEINGAGWHGRAACGRYRGGRASAPGRVVPITTAMVMGCMAWRCIRWGVKPHPVLHTPRP
jgi:hypothetical protein